MCVGVCARCALCQPLEVLLLLPRRPWGWTSFEVKAVKRWMASGCWVGLDCGKELEIRYCSWVQEARLSGERNQAA